MAKLPIHLFENGTKINAINSKVIPNVGDRLWYNYTYYDVKSVVHVTDADEVTDFILNLEKVDPQPPAPLNYDDMKNGQKNAKKDKE